MHSFMNSRNYRKSRKLRNLKVARKMKVHHHHKLVPLSARLK
jgi:hypothetical protein